MPRDYRVRVTRAHAESANCNSFTWDSLSAEATSTSVITNIESFHSLGLSFASSTDPKLSVSPVSGNVAWRSRRGDGREPPGRSAPSSAPSCSASLPTSSRGERWGETLAGWAGGIHACTMQHPQPFMFLLTTPTSPLPPLHADLVISNMAPLPILLHKHLYSSGSVNASLR